MTDLPSPSFPVYDVPVQIVQGLIGDMSGRIDTFTAEAGTAITALQAFKAPDVPAPPNLVPVQVQVPTFPTVPAPNPKLFGTVDALDIPDFQDLSATLQGLLDEIDAEANAIPTFNPTVGAPNIPPAPPLPADQTTTFRALLADRPVIDPIVIPAAPDLNDPGVGTLVPYTIPPLPVLGTLPTFDATTPLFTDDPPSSEIVWVEPTYTPTVRNDVTNAIKAMIAGDFAMTPVVQAALYGASRDREIIVTRKAIDEATNDWAGRGFQMPPGMVAEQINVARQEGALRENDRARDVLQKAGDWQNKNLLEALGHGIELESQLITQFNNFAQRTFDVAKFAVDSRRLLFDSKVGLFRARNEQLNILCTVFETKFKLFLAPLEIMKSELEVQNLIGTINEQTLKVYSTRIQALGLLAQKFETLMNAAKVQSEIEKDKVDLWRGEIEAFSAFLNAEKIPYEIYDIQVRAEGTKATILEAEARAFGETVRAFEAKENIKIAVINAHLKALDTSVTKFLGLVNAERDRIAAQADAIRSESTAYSADVGRYSETLRFTGTQAQIKLQSQEANTRNNLAYFDTKARQFDALAQRIISLANLQKEAIQAAGQIAAQLSAGAMSAQHIQASISGSGSASTSSSFAYDSIHNFDETP